MVEVDPLNLVARLVLVVQVVPVVQVVSVVLVVLVPKDSVSGVVAVLMQVVSLNKSIITEQEREIVTLTYILFHIFL